MDVGSWLRSLGLGQYEAAFRDNSMDAEVLPELSDGDLAKLGVTPGGSKTPAQGDRGVWPGGQDCEAADKSFFID